MTDFTLIRQRLKYCEVEIESLFSAQENALSGVWSIKSTVSDDSRILEQFLIVDQEFVYKCSMKFSAIIHHLKSTLDNIVYLVASKEIALAENEERNVYFPIIENYVDWGSNLTRKLFKDRCQNKYYQLLLHLQPFASNITGDDSIVNPLILLKKCNNEDKHRQLKLVFMKLNDLDFEVSFRFRTESETCVPRGTIFSEAFHAGGLIQRFEVDSGFESYDSKTKIASELRVEGIDMPAQKFLSDCLDFVKTIADNFERFGEIADWNSSFKES